MFIKKVKKIFFACNLSRKCCVYMNEHWLVLSYMFKYCFAVSESVFCIEKCGIPVHVNTSSMGIN